MNFFNCNNKKVSKKEATTLVNKTLKEALDKEFKRTYEEMKQILLANGVKLENVDGILEDVKRETQVKMIEEFKKNLKLEMQKQSSPQQGQDTQQPNVGPPLKKGPS